MKRVGASVSRPHSSAWAVASVNGVLRGSERMVRAAAVAVSDFNALAMEDDALVLGS